MIEVTEWDGKTREMWVWNSEEDNKSKKLVVYIKKQKGFVYPVVTVSQVNGVIDTFMHCAEIEDTDIEVPQPRRMTSKELARWLNEKPSREWKCSASNIVHHEYTYFEDGNSAVEDNVLVRDGDEPWHMPNVVE